MSYGSWKARKESDGLWKFKLLSKLSGGLLIAVVLGLLVTFGSVYILSYSNVKSGFI